MSGKYTMSGKCPENGKMSGKCPESVQKTLQKIDCQKKLDNKKFRTKMNVRKRSRFGTFSGHANVRNLSGICTDIFPDIFVDIFRTFIFYRVC
jgi:hypothetical protein